MPYYPAIKRMPADMKTRTLAGLKRLRKQLDTEMPTRTRNQTLVLGTWNIRNFDDNRFLSGKRTDEDFYYIAEIISRFDVLAVQELCDDITPLKRIMNILGNDYKYIITDLTEGRSGNIERLGFIYDQTKVTFKGVTGELVLPAGQKILDGNKERQFSRTPFMCTFQSGWFKFALSTVHIYFGSDSGEKYERRIKEIEAVAKLLKKRATVDGSNKVGVNHILVGDFNIKNIGSRGFNALKKCGFEIYQNIKGSNKDQTRFYDQISFLTKPNELKFAQSGREKGVLQFFDSIYRTRDFDIYHDVLIKVVKTKIEKLKRDIASEKNRLIKAKTDKTKDRLKKSITSKTKSLKHWQDSLKDDVLLKDYYKKEWRTFRASDHLPLWVELKIDFSENYLKSL